MMKRREKMEATGQMEKMEATETMVVMAQMVKGELTLTMVRMEQMAKMELIEHLGKTAMMERMEKAVGDAKRVLFSQPPFCRDESTRWSHRRQAVGCRNNRADL